MKNFFRILSVAIAIALLIPSAAYAMPGGSTALGDVDSNGKN